MKKQTSLTIVGLLAFAGLNLTGCGGSAESRQVEVTVPQPPAMEPEVTTKYTEQMKTQQQAAPGS
jgi:hypothetical protein